MRLPFFNKKNEKLNIKLEWKSFLKKFKKIPIPKLQMNSIKSKLILTLILLTIFPLLISTFVSSIMIKKSVNQNYLDSLKSASSNLSRTIDEKYIYYESLITILSDDKIIKNNVGKNDELVLEALKNFLKSNINIKQTFLIYKNGRILSFPKDKWQIPNHTQILHNTLNNFNNALWSNIETKNNMLLVTITKTFYDADNNQIGIIGFTVDISEIQRIANSLLPTKTGHIIILDKNNTIISSKYKNLLGKSLIDVLGKKSKDLLSIKWIKDMLNNKSGHIEYNFLGSKKSIYFLNNFKLNWKIIAFIDVYEINSNTRTLTSIVIFVLIIFGLISLIIGSKMSHTIACHIKDISNCMQRSGTGDLTVLSDIKTNDEFAQLGKYFNDMIKSMRKLVSSIKDASSITQASSNLLSEDSKNLLSLSDKIKLSMDNIIDGTECQKNEINNIEKISSEFLDVAIVLNSLSSEIKGENIDINDNTKAAIISFNELNEKNKSTNESIKTIENRINLLNNSIENINLILNIITNISKQTNLLALNASIEAAKAGEFGRGFAVVANEIRSLSNETAKSAENIRQTINQIKDISNLTINDIYTVKENIENQNHALDKTGDSFAKLQKSINNISVTIEEIIKKINSLSIKTDGLKESIKNISIVSDGFKEVAEHTENLLNQQLNEISNITKQTTSLNEITNHLTNIIEQFTL
jgi:methyl-accepting chemotaxis protein